VYCAVRRETISTPDYLLASCRFSCAPVGRGVFFGEIELPFISRKISANDGADEVNQVVHLKEPEPRRFVSASGDNPAAIGADRQSRYRPIGSCC
jgi:hypothetical protein